MADRQIDPSRLQGEALRRWYLRSPDEIERQRQTAEAQRYDDFFGGSRQGNPDPGFARETEDPVRNVDPGFTRELPRPRQDIDPGFDWIQAGPNRWRSVPVGPQPLGQAANLLSDQQNGGAYLDKGLAGSDDGGELVEIGNPHNPRLRREWQRQEGKDWPKTQSGRNYDVAHKDAIGDGGTNTVGNIRPMDPDAHRAEHKANGDFARWGARGARPKIPVPPRGGPIVRGLGVLGIIPNITGMLSGRIRTDNFDNFTSDMMGFPSQEDQRKAFENHQRSLNPKWKPGDPIMV